MTYLIDPPNPWGPLEAWRLFVAELESELVENPGDEDLEAALKEAREHIAEAEAKAAKP